MLSGGARASSSAHARGAHRQGRPRARRSRRTRASSLGRLRAEARPDLAPRDQLGLAALDGFDATVNLVLPLRGHLDRLEALAQREHREGQRSTFRSSSRSCTPFSTTRRHGSSNRLHRHCSLSRPCPKRFAKTPSAPCSCWRAAEPALRRWERDDRYFDSACSAAKRSPAGVRCGWKAYWTSSPTTSVVFAMNVVPLSTL